MAGQDFSRTGLKAALGQLERVLVLVDAVLGIRRGELLGLQWQDIDFDKHEVNVCRSIYPQAVGHCKTENLA
jgi:integrase